MNLFISNVLALTALTFLTACNTMNKNSEGLRQPQSYEDVELYATDNATEDGFEFDYDQNDPPTVLEVFSKYCKGNLSKEIKIKNRVVTLLNGQYVSGNVTSTFDSGAIIEIGLDYGPTSTFQKAQTIKRPAAEVSKALSCVGTNSKVIYGLFQIDNKLYTGHVREVFENGIVRYVNDNFQEQFTTFDKVQLENLKSNYKFKNALFTAKGVTKQGQIRRIFQNDSLLIKVKQDFYLRKIPEVKIQD